MSQQHARLCCLRRFPCIGPWYFAPPTAWQRTSTCRWTWLTAGSTTWGFSTSARQCNNKPTSLPSFSAILAAAAFSAIDADGIERSANDVITQARQIAHAAAAHDHD